MLAVVPTGSSLVSPGLPARVCPRRRNASKSAGIARAPKAFLTQLSACPPTQMRAPRAESSLDIGAPGRQQQQWCRKGTASGWSLPIAGGADVSPRYVGLEVPEGAWFQAKFLKLWCHLGFCGGAPSARSERIEEVQTTTSLATNRGAAA